MKRILSVLVIISMVVSFTLITSAQTDQPVQTSDQKTVEQKIYSDAKLEDNFVPGEVIVVLTTKASVINREYAAKNFSEIRAEKIEDLTYIENEKAFEWITLRTITKSSKSPLPKTLTRLN